MHHSLATVVLAVLALRPSIPAQCQLEWLRSDPPNGPVHAMSFLANGSLLVGGEFTHAGGQAAGRIALWNGYRWSPMGPGLRSTSSLSVTRVNAVVQRPDGTVFAAGTFDRAGEVVVNRIAAWNGQWWEPLGTGCSNTVNALALLPSGRVVAGGSFSQAGGSPASRIAVWNGTTWTALGSGLGGTVFALEVLPNGDLLAGGSFSSAGGASSSRVARWDGLQWHSMGFGGTQPPTVKDFVVRANGDIVAVGEGAGGATQVAYRWTGTGWATLTSQILSSPIGSARTAFEDANGDLLVLGDMVLFGAPCYLAKLSGSSWSAVVGPSAPANCAALASNGRILIGGEFSSAGGNATGGIAAWDGGSHFGTLGGGTDAPVEDIGVNRGRVALGGQFAVVGGLPCAGVPELSSGGTQSVGLRQFPRIGYTAAGVLTGSDGPNGASPSPLQWDGSSWVGVGAPSVPGTFGGPLSVRSSETTKDGDVVVVGYNATPFNGSFWWRATRLAGTSWTTPVSISGNNGIDVRGGYPYYPMPPGLYPGWGFSRGLLGPIANGQPQCSVEYSGDWVVGGGFTSMTVAGSAPVVVNHVARMAQNGQVAQALGGGLNGPVLALLVMPNGYLVAGGGFTQAGGVLARHLAIWDGVAWAELGGGTNGPVLDLALMPDETLVVGGDFSTAGGLPVSNLAFLGTRCAAAVQTVGAGCAGTAGLLQASALTSPSLGNLFRSRCTGFGVNSIGFALLGFQSPGTPLQSLHPAAGASCNLWASATSSLLALPTNGVATSAWGMPASTEWLGLQFYHQYLQVELGALGSIAAIHSSNGLRLTLGYP